MSDSVIYLSLGGEVKGQRSEVAAWVADLDILVKVWGAPKNVLLTSVYVSLMSVWIRVWIDVCVCLDVCVLVAEL